MAGQISLNDVPERLREMVAGMMLSPIYRLACQVLEHTTQQGRSQALDQIPSTVRILVEVEARKLYERRRAAKINRL